MAIRNSSIALRVAVIIGLLCSLAGGAYLGMAVQAQGPAPSASVSLLGTVKMVSGNTVTLSTDTGQTVTVTVPATAQVVQLPVGSTDLKAAKPGQFSDIALGDRVLATGKAEAGATSFNALRVVLIKSTAIAQMQAEQQADWKARGTGGIVSSVDSAKGIITLQSGSKKLTVTISSTTKFRRFEGDSVKYEDSKPGTIAQIQPKDQMQVLGNKSADATTIQAEEIMSGSFLNLSGLVTSIDQATGKITFKDLATKKSMTVNVTSNCDMRNIPLMTATRIAAQTNGGGPSGGRGGRRGGGTSGAAGVDDAGTNDTAGTTGQEDTAGAMRRSAGADLSQMMPRLPTIKLTDLKIGDAVMVVASEPSPGASTVDAITLVSGVEPILTANPNGGMSLGMSIGGGGGE
ncbi:MAG TPA: hypothetical protein VMQ60_14085 [Acidobacteriaceae bacterium]|nr:hypothetical protein [Acidobacteriaceae bacterium]